MIRFGPAGNDDSFYNEGHKASVEAPEWLFNNGLTAYEYAFTRGVNLGEETARAIGEAAKKFNIEISVHAPFYINFANTSEEMVEKSYKYILDCLSKLPFLNGNRVVFHAASQGKLNRKEAVDLTYGRIKELVKRVKESGYKNVYLCPETMGKQAQIGTFKEIIDLCEIDEMLLPTFDFGHINALTQGSLKSKEDFLQIFNYCIDKLGYERTKKVHIHFSKIEYGAKGEIRHLTFEDEKYGPNFEPLSQAIKELGLEPVIICESAGTQAVDAKIMKNIFEKTI